VSGNCNFYDPKLLSHQFTIMLSATCYAAPMKLYYFPCNIWWHL